MDKTATPTEQRARCSPSILVCLFMGLTTACSSEGLVGDERDGRQSDGQDVGMKDGGCWERSELTAIPASDPAFFESPALWAESAAGSWSNSGGDAWSVQFESAAMRMQWNCYDDPLIPPPGGARPYVELQLKAHATLRTADGAWNEPLDLAVTLTSRATSSGKMMFLSGVGYVKLAAIQGNFTLPAEASTKATDSVTVIGEFQHSGWLVDRDVHSLPTGSGGDWPSAWRAPTLAFVKP